LLATVEKLSSRRIAVLGLEEKIDTNSAAGRAGFPRVRRHRAFRAAAHRGTRKRRHRRRTCARQAVRTSTDKIAAALKLAQAGLSPTAAAKQLGLGGSTLYREISRTGIERAL
jgi:DNA invertase Pin-like site-specific DNA recombinase